MRLGFRCFLILLLILGFFKTGYNASSKSQPSILKQWLPDSILGWHVEEKDQIYTSDNLYTFIDGGAELYLAYGFQKLFHRIYIRPGYPDVLVDVYDMGTSANAFGIFMHSRQKIDTTFGQGSEYVQGFLNFWKNKYFISILALAETPQSKKLIFKLASLIEKQIKNEGEIPPLVKKLPQKGLKPATVRYFRNFIWINSYFSFPDKNIFNIDQHDQIAMAKYQNGTTVLLIHYAHPKKAEQVWQQLKSKYCPQLQKDSTVKLKNNYCKIHFKKSYLVIVSNNQNPPSMNKFLKIVLQKIK